MGIMGDALGKPLQSAVAAEKVSVAYFSNSTMSFAPHLLRHSAGRRNVGKRNPAMGIWRIGY